MRQVALVLLAGCLALHAQAEASAAGQAPGACSLLTRELVLKVTPMDKSLVDLVPPGEETLGTTGSACEYGGINLQVDPFGPARLDALFKERGTDWTSVPGVGEAAYLFDNHGEFAELYVRAGAHVLTIQMTVPRGRIVESIRPNVVALAQALERKLR